MVAAGLFFFSFCANVIASGGGFGGAGTAFSTTGLGGAGGTGFSTTGFGGGGAAFSTTGFGGGVATAFSTTGLGGGGAGFSAGRATFSTEGTASDSLPSGLAPAAPPPSPKTWSGIMGLSPVRKTV